MTRSDRYRTTCDCRSLAYPYTVRNTHRKESTVKNFPVRAAQSLWLTAAMLVVLSVASWKDPYGPWYWSTLVVYAVQCVYGFCARRLAEAGVSGPSWRVRDSRAEDGDLRPPKA